MTSHSDASAATYDYPHAPPELIAGLRRYADERLEPGGLVTALLENDLARAVVVLHPSLGVDALRDLVWYVHNELPSTSHGSRDAVRAWLAGAAPPPREAPTMARVGDVFQVDPAHDDVFGASFLTVTEPKSWGVQGFVHMPGAGDAYYRAPWAALVYIGTAEWSHATDDGEGA